MEINIEIEDDKLYTCAAFILDQDDLLDKIFEIRKCWDIHKKLVPYNEFDIWLKQFHYDFSLTPEVATYWVNAKDKLPSFSFTKIEPTASLEIQQKIIDSDPMDLEIEYLLRKNGLPASYKNFMLKAVVCGEVTLKDWESTNSNEKFYHGDWMLDILTYQKLYKGRLKEEIRRDRKWHWQFKTGKTDIEIAQETTYRDDKIDPEDYKENYVKPALKRYKHFLKIKGRIKRS